MEPYATSGQGRESSPQALSYTVLAGKSSKRKLEMLFDE
jgi:hypothetical protein